LRFFQGNLHPSLSKTTILDKNYCLDVHFVRPSTNHVRMTPSFCIYPADAQLPADMFLRVRAGKNPSTWTLPVRTNATKLHPRGSVVHPRRCTKASSRTLPVCADILKRPHGRCRSTNIACSSLPHAPSLLAPSFPHSLPPSLASVRTG
jgi:hypothetical protein